MDRLLIFFDSDHDGEINLDDFLKGEAPPPGSSAMRAVAARRRGAATAAVTTLAASPVLLFPLAPAQAFVTTTGP